MDGSHFDDLTRALTASRRSLLTGALAAGAGLLVVPSVEAKKKRKQKKRKPKAQPNAFGCLEVGDPCKNAEQCCSGICEGKKGKRTCRAHDTGVCRQEDPGICRETNSALAVCAANCLCFRTTAGSNVCADLGGFACADCQKDADCLAQGLPAGAACVPVSEGNCFGQCAGSTACVVPCGTELPEPTE